MLQGEEVTLSSARKRRWKSKQHTPLHKSRYHDCTTTPTHPQTAQIVVGEEEEEEDHKEHTTSATTAQPQQEKRGEDGTSAPQSQLPENKGTQATSYPGAQSRSFLERKLGSQASTLPTDSFQWSGTRVCAKLWRRDLSRCSTRRTRT